MTKEEYLIELGKLETQASELRKEIKSLGYRYLEENAEFQEGEIVEVEMNDGSKGKAFFNRYHISYGGDIEIILDKMKKDGTPSKQELQKWYYKKGTIKKLI